MKIQQLPKRVILSGGTILDPVKGTTQKGDVLIEKDQIASVGKVEQKSSDKVLDCRGLIITHGFCDVHVHFREPGREDKETLFTGSQAALAGGFTRVCVMPNTNPPLDTPESIRFIKEKAEECPIHIHPIGAVSHSQRGKELAELGAMYEEGAVAFSDDGLPITDGRVLRMALEYSTIFDVPIINHAEDECLRNEGVMNESAVSTRLGLPGNLDLSESIMVHRDLELCELTGAKLHVPHVSTKKAAEHIREMKIKISKVTAEVTPHHLYFNDEALTSYNTNLKVAPPIRTEADRVALIEAVKEGTFDCIATDHAPHTIEEKEATFDLAPFGMIGLESCFGVVNKVLVKDNDFDRIELVKLLTVNPRKIMGFHSDLFQVGTPAELTVIHPDEEWVFDKKHVHSRSINSPFYGELLSGKVRMTISKGNLAIIEE